MVGGSSELTGNKDAVCATIFHRYTRYDESIAVVLGSFTSFVVDLDTTTEELNVDRSVLNCYIVP